MASAEGAHEICSLIENVQYISHIDNIKFVKWHCLSRGTLISLQL